MPPSSRAGLSPEHLPTCLVPRPTRMPARTRPREHDLAVLFYLGREQLATLDQVILRFWVLRGKGSRNGYRVVGRLIESGLVDGVPLDAERGGASRMILRLTDRGWTATGFQRPRVLPKEGNERAQWDFILQQTEVRLILEATGWRHVPRPDAFSILRRWALDAYRNRPLTDTEKVERRFLENGSPFHVAERVVHHDATGKVQLLIPIREGESFRKTVDSLPHFRHFPPVRLHLISTDVALCRRAKDYIRRWSRAGRVRLEEIRETKNHRLRAAAYRMKIGTDVYAKHGVRVPHSLIPPGTAEP